MKLTIPHGFSRCWIISAMAAATAVGVQAQTAVTFQIDMSTETATPVTSVYISGSFNGWGYQAPGDALVNSNGSSIWTNTFIINDTPGTVENCKFQDNTTGWEPIAANRQFVLGSGTQVLPLTQWNNSNWPVPTNWVTFQVNMSAQVALGAFTNGDPNGSITVSGDFEGWNNGLPLTNNPTLSGSASNIYSAALPVQFYPPSTTVNYKFRMNGGWESPASTAGGNRQATVTPNEVLPLVYYNDNSIYDLILNPVTVTFTLYMTNGTVDDNGYAYNNSSDTLWITGDFLGWNGGSWPGPLNNFPAAQQMVEVGTSDYYTNSFVLPKGNSVYVNYKYAIDSEDDENGFQTNHIREVRTYGSTYSFPTDAWAWSVVQPGVEPYPNPGVTITNLVETDFGNLTISPGSIGTQNVSWLGRPGVLLQNSSSLTGGWNANAGSDAIEGSGWPTNSTFNWSGSASNQFFRLQKEQ